MGIGGWLGAEGGTEDGPVIVQIQIDLATETQIHTAGIGALELLKLITKRQTGSNPSVMSCPTPCREQDIKGERESVEKTLRIHWVNALLQVFKSAIDHPLGLEIFLRDHDSFCTVGDCNVFIYITNVFIS